MLGCRFLVSFLLSKCVRPEGVDCGRVELELTGKQDIYVCGKCGVCLDEEMGKSIEGLSWHIPGCLVEDFGRGVEFEQTELLVDMMIRISA